MNYQFKTFVTVCFLSLVGIQSSFCQEATNAKIVKHEKVSIQSDDNSLFDNYKWLNNIIKKENCGNESISIYKDANSGTEFISVFNGKKKIMYDTSGKVYCTDSKELNCLEFYKLIKTEQEWICRN